jgi:hypothetical protein
MVPPGDGGAGYICSTTPIYCSKKLKGNPKFLYTKENIFYNSGISPMRDLINNQSLNLKGAYSGKTNAPGDASYIVDEFNNGADAYTYETVNTSQGYIKLYKEIYYAGFAFHADSGRHGGGKGWAAVGVDISRIIRL